MLATNPLSPGDIAIIGYSADLTDDPFAWVPLVSLDAGTTVFFTDDGWTAGGTFRGAEGTITWTAPAGGLAAGTVMTIDLIGGVPTNPSPNLGTYNYDSGSFLVSTLGDNLFVFDGSVGSPNFIFGLKTEDGSYEGDSTSNDSSALPGALTLNTDAVAFGSPGHAGSPVSSVDNARYAGTTSGTAADLLAEISNPDNWEFGSAVSASNRARVAAPSASNRSRPRKAALGKASARRRASRVLPLKSGPTM